MIQLHSIVGGWPLPEKGGGKDDDLSSNKLTTPF